MCEDSRVIIFLVTVLLRWCATYHPYSGQGKPPMFGDYEAQRHWQEVTFNLPYQEWYTNSSNNDLQYWGLDYPPLTAYHSLLLGYAANKANPDYVKLGDSRGFESDGHKLFMRLSVIIADILIYMPAMFWFVSKLQITASEKVNDSDSNIFALKKRDFILISILIYPGLILIDHGHFQYNCVSLGLFVAAVTAILQRKLLVSSCFFTLALNYKQMELYHSLPFFIYILSSNIVYKKQSLTIQFRKLVFVALVVLITFAVIWSPFLLSIEVFFNVIDRLFPLARGLFEDKVANFWCTVNVLYKLRDTFSNLTLAKICLVATLVSVLPSNLDLFRKPTNEKFILSLINTSLAFFLFSYQVHEKSILLVAVPVLLYTHEDPLGCFWFSIISNFSMLPLYAKDQLLVAYVAITTFYILSFCWMFSDIFCLPNEKSERTSEMKNDLSKASGSLRKTRSKRESSKLDSIEEDPFKNVNWNRLAIRLFYASMVGMLFLTLGMFCLKPPKRYPDLFPVLISLYSFEHFFLFFIYFHFKQFTSDTSNNKIKSM